VLSNALSGLFDSRRGVFGEDKASAPALDANGVMADALLRADAVARRRDYLEASRRVLAALDTAVHALLVDDQDETARVADAVYYLRAYARLVGSAEGAERRR
jgi:hypothetical protein